MVEIIKPMRKKCECGNKVLNHHWLCDLCWGRKAKEKQRILTNIPKIQKYMVRMIIKDSKDLDKVLDIIERVKLNKSEILFNNRTRDYISLREKEAGK